MCSERTKYKCRFGCGETFRTAEGRNYHESKRHRTWVTPTIKTTVQLFDLSHVCDWNRSVANQLNITQDRLDVDSCF